MTVINTNIKALYTQNALKLSNRASQEAMQQHTCLYRAIAEIAGSIKYDAAVAELGFIIICFFIVLDTSNVRNGYGTRAGYRKLPFLY